MNEASEEEMLSWVRSVKTFKKRASKNKNLDARNMLMARVIQGVLIYFLMSTMWIRKIYCDRILCELIS